MMASRLSSFTSCTFETVARRLVCSIFLSLMIDILVTGDRRSPGWLEYAVSLSIDYLDFAPAAWSTVTTKV
jgi:hypothetical protein